MKSEPEVIPCALEIIGSLQSIIKKVSFSKDFKKTLKIQRQLLDFFKYFLIFNNRIEHTRDAEVLDFNLFKENKCNW